MEPLGKSCACPVRSQECGACRTAPTGLPARYSRGPVCKQVQMQWIWRSKPCSGDQINLGTGVFPPGVKLRNCSLSSFYKQASRDRTIPVYSHLTMATADVKPDQPLLDGLVVFGPRASSPPPTDLNSPPV